jgi:outer membrane protein assembly factor BamB
VVPAPDGVPAFDYRAPSPLLQRGVKRLATLNGAHAAPLEFLWIFEPAEDCWLGVAEIVGDVMVLGSEYGILGLDRTSGEIRWSVDPPDGVWFDPDDCFHVAEGLVLVASGDEVTAYDAATGSTMWTYDASRSGGLRYDVPIQSHGNLIGVRTGWSFNVLDVSTGQETCSYLCQHQSSLLHDLLYILDHNTTIKAMNPRTGKLLWKTDINDGWPLPSRLEVHDGIVLVMSGTTLHEEPEVLDLPDDHVINAFDGQTGKRLWQVKPAWRRSIVESPTVYDSMACVNTAWGQINALDLQTGRERWMIQTNREWPWIMSAGGLFHMEDETRTLIVLDALSGMERWRFQSPTGSPTVVATQGGIAYIGTGSALYALNELDGIELWRLPFECPDFAKGLYVTITEDGDTAYIASHTGLYWDKHDGETGCDVGTVYAVETRTGQLKWKIDGFDTTVSICIDE